MMDFITGLLKLKDLVNKYKYNRIITIVDKATKYLYFRLYKERTRVEEVA